MSETKILLNKFCIQKEQDVDINEFCFKIIYDDQQYKSNILQQDAQDLQEEFTLNILNEEQKIEINFLLLDQQEQVLGDNTFQLQIQDIIECQQMNIDVQKEEKKIANVQFECKIQIEKQQLDNQVEQNQEVNDEVEQPEQKHEDQEIQQQIDQEFYNDEEVNEQSEQVDTQNQKKKKTKTKKTTKKKIKQKQEFVLHGLVNEKMKTYDGLKDENLQAFFYSKDKKKHLQKMGLITKKGYIIEKPEEYLRRKEFYKKVKQEQKIFKQQQKKLQTKIVDPYKENLQLDVDKQYITQKKSQQNKEKPLKQNIEPIENQQLIFKQQNFYNLTENEIEYYIFLCFICDLFIQTNSKVRRTSIVNIIAKKITKKSFLIKFIITFVNEFNDGCLSNVSICLSQYFILRICLNYKQYCFLITWTKCFSMPLLNVPEICDHPKKQAFKIVAEAIKQQKRFLVNEIQKFLEKSKFVIGMSEVKMTRILRRQLMGLMESYGSLTPENVMYVNQLGQASLENSDYADKLAQQMLADDDMKPLDEEGNEIDNDEDNDNNRI